MKTLHNLRTLFWIFIAAVLVFKPIIAQEIQSELKSNGSIEKSKSVSAAKKSISIKNENLTPPENDNFAGVQPIFYSPGSSYLGTNIEATGESGEPNPGNDSVRNSVWFKWTAPTYMGAEINTIGSNFDTTLAVFTGDGLSNLVLVGYNDDIAGGNSASRVRFNTAVGVTYYIAVDGFGSNTGNIEIVARTAPTNQLFANFINLGNSPSGRFVGSNVDAANEAGEPGLAYLTVWHRWTAPSTGTVVFNTCSSNTSSLTYLQIYTGTNINNLNFLDGTIGGCNDTPIPLFVTAGVTYIIRVGNFTQNTQGSSFSLDWGKPVEDDFNILNGVYNFSNTIGATGQGSGEPNHANASTPLNSVWYKFSVNENTLVQMDTRGSFFDTTLAVYTGNSIGALTLVAENDDESSGVTTSRVTFLAVPGRTYHIAVDGFASQVGYFYLNYAFFVTAPFDFDGDAKTDVSIFRPSGGEWWYLRSSDGGNRAFQFGQSTDKLV
ncbi:MAG TPA: PPC domain-containing protein, partial [Pyrinomonadaceae bacterium]|nr:PPC domain-containing protein [Pyrinomonadaceae bacterium]